VKRKHVFIWMALLAAATAIALVLLLHRWSENGTRIQGAVIRHEGDTRRELPISDVVVTASDGVTTATTKSNDSGYFSLPFRGGVGGVWTGKTVTLSFSHPDYEPLTIKVTSGFLQAAKKLYVAEMVHKPEQNGPDLGIQLIAVTNIRVRHTINTPTEANIGSAVQTFQVVNRGNVPCNHQAPCSPHGNWKASIGSISLDAGVGNEFGSVRASCIAGPCPFTQIDSNGFAHGGRNITVSALNWSDTASFLVEAEVLHVGINSSVHESYPAVFGRELDFTLPPTQEGVSLEAEVDGTPMVFPLGPDLYLSWATCTARTNSGEDKTTVYRCELKPGYRF